MQYLIECFIENKAKEKIKQLRPIHLEYIGKNKESITFGGIVVDEQGDYQKILYNYSCSEEKEALNFVKGDPYYEIFDKTIVSPFLRKI